MLSLCRRRSGFYKWIFRLMKMYIPHGSRREKLDEMIIGGDDDHETTSGTAGR